MTNLKFLFFGIFSILFLFKNVEAVPKFSVSRNAILKRVPELITPFMTNEQNLKLSMSLLNCTYIVRNVTQCGKKFLTEAKSLLSTSQESKINKAASDYLLKVGPTATIHIDLLCNILYDKIKTSLWDKSQKLAKKFKKFKKFQEALANMVNKTVNKNYICKIAKTIKNQFGLTSWQAARDSFGDIATAISKCAL